MMEKKSLIHYIGLTMFLSAFFVSCNKKNDQVGLDIQESEGTIGHNLLKDEINLSLGGIIKNDTLLTSGSDLIHIGRFTDAYVGEVKSTSFFQIAMENDLPNFVSNTCDSLFLNLAFNLNTTTNRVLQGNSLVNNTIEVYQMTQFFATDVTYNNQQTFAYNTEVLGSLNYNPLQETGYLSIKLNKTFGDSLIKWANGKTIDQFKSSLAGLALKGTSSDGSIVSFNLNSENSFLKTYYSKDGQSLNYNFNLSTSLRHHIFIESDRQGANFSALNKTTLVLSTELNNQLLIQNGTGASVWVNLGDIKTLLANKKNILINKAELYLPIKSGTANTQSDLPVYYLNMFESDSQGNFILSAGLKQRVVPDLNKVVKAGAGLFILSDDNLSYKCDITYYIQEYILGERDLNSFLITPNIIYNSVNYQARTNRTVIDASKASFKIYYSEL